MADGENLEKYRGEIREAARRMDPRTAVLTWDFGQVLDPYGIREVEPEEYCVGRNYFLFDPDDGPWVWEPDVRELHPGFSPDEWSRLMVKAATRDDVVDPLSMFHAFRGAGSPGGEPSVAADHG